MDLQEITSGRRVSPQPGSLCQARFVDAVLGRPNRERAAVSDLVGRATVCVHTAYADV